MTILDLLDRVERGELRDDRYPARMAVMADHEEVAYTYTLADAMEHAQQVLVTYDDGIVGRTKR